MTTRVLVTLEPGADAAQVASELTRLGASSVSPPRPELPGVAVAELDETKRDPSQFVDRAQGVSGVAVAELDQLRWSM